ncbi:MAG: hypothetical protein LBL36_02140, partial [Clostridiales Family XIII bacterium]|nr:hypothetical protein [Clostridiales Family XIII bacterium]
VCFAARFYSAAQFCEIGGRGLAAYGPVGLFREMGKIWKSVQRGFSEVPFTISNLRKQPHAPKILHTLAGLSVNGDCGAEAAMINGNAVISVPSSAVADKTKSAHAHSARARS